MKNTKKRYAFLWICAAIVNIKSIFCDYDLDAAYTVAMSYRHINGDRLFLKMWEPHQTSIFFVDFFALLWRKITGSFDGVALWLQFCGCLFFLAVSILLYFAVKRITSKDIAMFISVLFWILRPKNIQLSDYSNLLVLLSTLAFIIFSFYLTSEKKKLYLVLLGICTSALVLAYPSAIVVALAIEIMIVIWAEKKKRDALLYPAVCIVLAICYLFIIARDTPLPIIMENVEYIVSGDTHSSFRYRGWLFFREILIGCAVSTISFLFAKVLSMVKRKDCFVTIRIFLEIQALLFCALTVLCKFIKISENINDKSFYFFLFPVYVFCGFFLLKKQKKELSKIYISGTIISLCAMLSAVFLSNLPLIASLGYMPLAALLSLTAFSTAEDLKQEEGKARINKQGLVFATFFVMAVFQRIFVITSTAGISYIYEVENYIRTGPEKGIVSTLEFCNEKKIGLGDWKNNVSADDTVLIARGFGVDVSDYLLAGAKVGTNSVISTPSFNETLGEYWRLNPEKKPTVIAVACWGGNEFRTADQWIYDVIDSEYQLSYEGTYWNFYKPYIQN